MKLENSSPLTVVLIDDCDLATAGLRSILTPYVDRVTLVDTREALAHPGALDVILYEPMGMSTMAASLLRDLQHTGHAHTAVFSWATQDQLPTPTARPHLSKRLTASQLVVALEELMSGRFTAAAAVTEPAPEPEPEPEPRHERVVDHDVLLTPREGDVIALIAAGRSNLEISAHLGLSINSVKTYIRSAYRKIGVGRRSQAVLWGVTNGYDGEAVVAAATA
ncbi:MAG: LuxR C-terminal-related transcriptional regulator [Nocardioides sp.]|nr:LuxR C-terminal-related transcriptional regulator [Nocardioides sp.]